MKLYLVQHGEALSEEENPARPLSEIGRQHATWVAEAAAKMGVKVAQIRHSGKTRAKQTAEIMGEALEPAEGVVAVSWLSPLDDVATAARGLDEATQPVMLVGHLPFMERMAGYLLAGDPDRAVIDFTKAGIVCLARDDDRWQAQWILLPEMAKPAG